MDHIAPGDEGVATDEEVADEPLTDLEETALLMLLELFPIDD